MDKKKKIGITLALLTFLAILGFVAGVYISDRIKSEINSLLGTSSSYKEIDVDLFQQNIHIKDLNFISPGRNLSVPQISLRGLSYYQYLKNDKLAFDEIKLINPEFSVQSSTEDNPKKKKNFKKEIQIKKFRVSNGVFKLHKKDSSKNEVFIKFPEFEISGIRIDSATLSNPFPFSYDSYTLKADSLRVNMNLQHFMAAEGFSVHNGKTSVKNFRIIPYKERVAFDQSIPYEKDRIALKVDSIGLDSLTFDLRKDTIFLKNPLMKISGADLDIYRNKLLPDDPRVKSLYSKMLREAPVKLDFTKIRVEKSKITYDEKVKAQQPPSTVTFNKVQGTIENFVNIQMQRKDFPRTVITADALFMNSSPLSIKWSFNAANTNDEFLISGDFGTLAGNTLDPLLKPSLGLEAEGKLKSVYFNFTGNDDVLRGDVLVDYEQFKINIMKDEQKKNKLLSALANLFVDNDGISDQHTQHVRVTRDKTKSFWNYLWMGLKKGVIDALAQF